MWLLTPDTWHLTHDMWHLLHDMCHVAHMGWWTLCQKFSYLPLTVWKLWCFEDLREKDQSMTKLISDKGVCRTAPATPGLLITKILSSQANARNILFDQKSSGHPEAGVLNCHRQTDRQTGIAFLWLDQPRSQYIEKLWDIVFNWPLCFLLNNI